MQRRRNVYVRRMYLLCKQCGYLREIDDAWGMMAK